MGISAFSGSGLGQTTSTPPPDDRQFNIWKKYLDQIFHVIPIPVLGPPPQPATS